MGMFLCLFRDLCQTGNPRLRLKERGKLVILEKFCTHETNFRRTSRKLSSSTSDWLNFRSQL